MTLVLPPSWHAAPKTVPYKSTRAEEISDARCHRIPTRSTVLADPTGSITRARWIRPASIKHIEQKLQWFEYVKGHCWCNCYFKRIEPPTNAINNPIIIMSCHACIIELTRRFIS